MLILNYCNNSRDNCMRYEGRLSYWEMDDTVLCLFFTLVHSLHLCSFSSVVSSSVSTDELYNESVECIDYSI